MCFFFCFPFFSHIPQINHLSICFLVAQEEKNVDNFDFVVVVVVVDSLLFAVSAKNVVYTTNQHTFTPIYPHITDKLCSYRGSMVFSLSSFKIKDSLKALFDWNANVERNTAFI